MKNMELIVSLISLIISGILAYSYLQIRLSLAETILQVLNGRYMKRDVGDIQMKRLEEMQVANFKRLEEIQQGDMKSMKEALSTMQKDIKEMKDGGCDLFRHGGGHAHEVGRNSKDGD